MRAAMYFSKVARQVTMVLRGDSLKSTLSSYLLDRIYSAKSIQVLTNTEVTALDGDQCLRTISLTNRKTGERITFHTRWLFICIGGAPHTSWAAEAGVIRDEADTWSPAQICSAAAKLPAAGRSIAIRIISRPAFRAYSQRVTSGMAL